MKRIETSALMSVVGGSQGSYSLGYAIGSAIHALIQFIDVASSSGANLGNHGH